MNLDQIFYSKSRQLYWERLADDHVADGSRPTAIPKNEAYFLLRMKEMYVAYSRKLWRKYYPMLHSYVEHGKTQENAIAGPGQLRELSDSNLERIVNLNYRLAGPIPFSGEDVSVLAGLYSVPGEDAAKALIETVASLAMLGGVALGAAPEIANTVKSGVECILGLNDSKLQLGIRDTFNPGTPLRSGFHVGISAPKGSIDMSELWLKNGRLVKGRDPVVAQPYQDHDYMVLEIERRDTRDDWPSLPGIAEYQDKLVAVMADNASTVATKGNKLAELWPGFREVLATSRFLTQPDRENIAHSVSEDLKRRLKAMESNNPFIETRGWESTKEHAVSPGQFDFLDVPAYSDRANPESLRRANVALTGNPFE